MIGIAQPNAYIAAMLKSVLHCLLTLCLALPAMAAPAPRADPVPVSMAMHRSHHGGADHSRHDGADHAGKHQCIGCAVPADSGAAAVAAPIDASGPHRPALSQRLGNTRGGPAPPPPRC